MSMLTVLFLFCAGGIVTMIIDTLWWHVNYKKIEKGMEVLEHYHLGLGLLILAFVVQLYYEPISWFLTGMGFFFIIAEWHQSIEISSEKTVQKVVPGKPFAYGSVHFRGSSIIGIILAVILLIISIVL